MFIYTYSYTILYTKCSVFRVRSLARLLIFVYMGGCSRAACGRHNMGFPRRSNTPHPFEHTARHFKNFKNQFKRFWTWDPPPSFQEPGSPFQEFQEFLEMGSGGGGILEILEMGMRFACFKAFHAPDFLKWLAGFLK